MKSIVFAGVPVQDIYAILTSLGPRLYLRKKVIGDLDRRVKMRLTIF